MQMEAWIPDSPLPQPRLLSQKNIIEPSPLRMGSPTKQVTTTAPAKQTSVRSSRRLTIISDAKYASEDMKDLWTSVSTEKASGDAQQGTSSRRSKKPEVEICYMEDLGSILDVDAVEDNLEAESKEISLKISTPTKVS